MTRRSFCFLFGAGAAAVVVAAKTQAYKLTGLTPMGETVPTIVLNSVPFNDARVVAHKIYTGNDYGRYQHIATVPAVGALLTMHFGDRELTFSADGKRVESTWLALNYRRREPCNALKKMESF